MVDVAQERRQEMRIPDHIIDWFYRIWFTCAIIISILNLIFN